MAVYWLQGMSLHISTSTTFNGNRMLTFVSLPERFMTAVSATFLEVFYNITLKMEKRGGNKIWVGQDYIR